MAVKWQDTRKINQDLRELNDPLEPLKVASALNSEIMKFNFRKDSKPEDISPLDYTVIVSLIRQTPSKAKAGKCPECKAEISCDAAYCSNCGQRILKR